MTDPRVALAVMLMGLSACSSGQSYSEQSYPQQSDPEQAESNVQPVTAVYRCQSEEGEVRLVTQTQPGGLHVFLPPGLKEPYLDCAYDHGDSIWEHAKLSGVDFRAQGNEPGWVLEIREGERLDLSYDYGQGELSVPVDQKRSDQEGRTTVFSGSSLGETLTVTLIGETCRDTMADNVFPTRVEVEFSGRHLKGCGRPLH